MIQEFITKIKNLITWIPIIWRDHQSDYATIYVILHKKLSQMEKYFSSDKPIVENKKKIYEQIKTCRIILERLIKSSFSEEENKIIDEYAEIMKVPYDKRTEIQKEMDKKIDKIVERKRQQEENDKRFLFYYLQKKINSWWD